MWWFEFGFGRTCMRFSENGFYIEKYLKCANCGLLVYGAGVTALVEGKKCLYCSDWCVEWAAYPAADRAYEIADRVGAAAAAGAQRAAGHGDDEDPGFDDGVYLPRNGHPSDEDVVLDDLQRGARLHLRAGGRAGRHDRLRRVLPDHDRRNAAAHQDLRPGDSVRYAGGRRHHRPQRSLSRRAALPGAHLLQAVLRRWRIDGLRGLHRPYRGDRRHGAR